MADDHNRLAGIGHLVHDAVDDVTAALGKCGGGFVHDQQFGVVGAKDHLGLAFVQLLFDFVVHDKRSF